MQFIYIVAASLATTVSAANFVNFVDIACQNWHGEYVALTASQLQDIVVQNYPAASTVPEASRFLTDQTQCPRNSDDTYRWVTIGPWQGVPAGQRNNGGNIAVVYYKETDTYNACRYVASSVNGGYVGRCR